MSHSNLKKHATKIIEDGNNITTVFILTVDNNNQTAAVATIRDPSREATDLLKRVGELVSGAHFDTWNKLPI